jgi:hypothetical protein
MRPRGVRASTIVLFLWTMISMGIGVGGVLVSLSANAMEARQLNPDPASP